MGNLPTNSRVLRLGLGAALAALVAVGTLSLVSSRTPAQAAEDDIYRENRELKDLLAAFGTGPVDIYANLEDVRDGKPAFQQIKMIRPVTALGKIFFRGKDAKGDIWLISPARIGAVRASAANFQAR